MPPQLHFPAVHVSAVPVQSLLVEHSGIIKGYIQLLNTSIQEESKAPGETPSTETGAGPYLQCRRKDCLAGFE